MGAKRGGMVYIPTVIIDEIEDIRREDRIESKSEAFKLMTKYARVGREVNRLKKLNYDWSKKKSKRMKVDDFEFDIMPFDIGVKK